MCTSNKICNRNAIYARRARILYAKLQNTPSSTWPCFYVKRERRSVSTNRFIFRNFDKTLASFYVPAANPNKIIKTS